MKQEITFEDYSKVEIKVGTVISVKKNEKARKPSLVIEVDFGGNIGLKKSSAQITHYYNNENFNSLQGKLPFHTFPFSNFLWMGHCFLHNFGHHVQHTRSDGGSWSLH